MERVSFCVFPYHLSGQIPHATIGKRLIYRERELVKFIKEKEG